MGKIEDLEKLQHLKEIGALTDEEFEKEKKIILNYNKSNDSVNIQQEMKELNSEQGKVIIHSYKGFYIVNPKIDVYIDNKLIVSLAKGETFEYPISKSTIITFKSSKESTKVTVNPNTITEIRLMWNRITGNLETVCNERNSRLGNNFYK